MPMCHEGHEELQKIEETDDTLISYNKAISIIRCIFS